MGKDNLPLVFKIRCSGAIHRILYKNGSWVIPDHTDAHSLYNKISEQQDKCRLFMELIRWTASPEYIENHLGGIGIGNQDLVRFVRSWASYRAYRQRKRYEESKAVPITQLYRYQAEDRAEKVLSARATRGWSKLCYRLLRVTQVQLKFRSSHEASVNGGTLFLYLKYKPWEIGLAPFYCDDSYCYLPLKNKGYVKLKFSFRGPSLLVQEVSDGGDQEQASGRTSNDPSQEGQPGRDFVFDI